MACALVLTLGAQAADSDFSFTINPGGSTVTITGYTGADGVLTIPATLDGGKTVTAIGADAFKGKTGLTGTLTLPAGVTTIGSSAFENCSGLSGSLTLANGITSIGSSAFSGCVGLSGTLKLPTGITAIAAKTFAGCENLTGVLTIPGGVVSIGESAFATCRKLSGILTIPNTVTSMGDSAFSNTGFTSLTLSSSLTAVGASAFYNCKLAGTLTVPQGVTTINAGAFDTCGELTTVVFPAGVTSIGAGAFNACGKLKAVRFLGNAPATFAGDTFSAAAAGFTIYYRTGATGFSTPAWNGYPCKAEVAPSISTQPTAQTVAAGGTATFTLAVAGDPVPTIQWQRDGADLGETGTTLQLTNVQMSSAGSYRAVVTNFAGSVVSQAAPLAVSGSSDGFAYSNSGTEITIIGYTGADGAITIPATIAGKPVTAIGENAFKGRTGLTAVTLPDGVVTIGRSAFYGCTGLKGELLLPESVTAIGTAAFYECSGLTGKLLLPPDITKIESYAFYWCRGLTGVVIPDGVTSIGQSAFYGCQGMNEIDFPSTVTEINDDAFNYCLALKAAHFLGGAPGAFGAAVFANAAPGFAIYYRAGASGFTSPTWKGYPTLVDAVPKFTTHPESQVALVGSTITLTVAVSGSPLPTLQWQKDGSNINNATGTTLKLTDAQTSQSGNYRVVASNALGSVTSDAATVTIGTEPKFTTQPAAKTTTPGSTVTFTVAVSGTPTPTLQWQKDGVDIKDATGTSLKLTNVQVEQAGSYRAVATNLLGKTTSEAAELLVNSIPKFTTQPTTQTAAVGVTVTFTVAVVGSPTPTIQWQKDGVDIKDATGTTLKLTDVQADQAGSYRAVATNSRGKTTSGAAVLAINYGPSFTTQPLAQTVAPGGTATFTVAVSGTPTPTIQWQKDGVDIKDATGTTLKLTNVQAAQAGSYRAVATNSVGKATSETAALAISSGPTFTTQPATKTTNEGSTVTFTIAVSGTPAPTLQWQKDGVDIKDATGTTLTLTNVQVAQAGSYRAVATNAVGSATSETAVLTINYAPKFTTQPAAITTNAGSTATFRVVVKGIPEPTIQWQKDGVDILGGTGSTLALGKVEATQAGSYRAVATNSIGKTNSEAAILTVNFAPKFTTLPTALAVAEGGTAKFTVAVAGSPTPTLQWQKDGVAIKDATGTTLTLANVQVSQAGNYRVLATNTLGDILSGSATLTVNYAPKFTTQPAAQTVAEGGTAKFTVAVAGSPTPTLQWQKDGVDVKDATGPTLTLAKVQAAHAGNYRVVATNTLGVVNSEVAVLKVSSTPIPVIGEQTKSASGVAGQPVTLSVTATGATAYQWYRNGRPIGAGTGPSLALPQLSPSDVGIYDCTLTGLTGNTLSAPVVVGLIPEAGQQPTGLIQATVPRTAGAVSTREEWQNIRHPNGAEYDQFILSGTAGTFTADAKQIARMSFLDLNDSIIQVEMSGAGAVTVVLDPNTASGPIAPALYNQSGVQYMRGKATIVLAGADETTHFTVYSVGTATNPGVTFPNVAYDGWADIAVAGIVSTNGKLGGIHQGNADYNANFGYAGLYAPSVTSVTDLVVIHGIDSSGTAMPYLHFGPGGTVRVKIAGSSLHQESGDPIIVSGLSSVQMGAGQDSCGRTAPAQNIQGRLHDAQGNDVTAGLVGGP